MAEAAAANRPRSTTSIRMIFPSVRANRQINYRLLRVTTPTNLPTIGPVVCWRDRNSIHCNDIDSLKGLSVVVPEMLLNPTRRLDACCSDLKVAIFRYWSVNSLQ